MASLIQREICESELITNSTFKSHPKERSFSLLSVMGKKVKDNLVLKGTHML